MSTTTRPGQRQLIDWRRGMKYEIRHTCRLKEQMSFSTDTFDTCGEVAICTGNCEKLRKYSRDAHGAPRIISGSHNSCFLLTYTTSKREEVVREAEYFNNHYKKRHIQVKQAVVIKNNTVAVLHGLGLLRAAACLLDYWCTQANKTGPDSVSGRFLSNGKCRLKSPGLHGVG